MPEDWNFDRKGIRDPWKNRKLYQGKASIVFTLPFLGYYRIAEHTRFPPMRIRQSMNTFRTWAECIEAFENEPIYFFPWRDIPDDLPVRQERKRRRGDRPPKSGTDAP